MEEGLSEQGFNPELIIMYLEILKSLQKDYDYTNLVTHLQQNPPLVTEGEIKNEVIVRLFNKGHMESLHFVTDKNSGEVEIEFIGKRENFVTELSDPEISFGVNFQIEERELFPNQGGRPHLIGTISSPCLNETLSWAWGFTDEELKLIKVGCFPHIENPTFFKNRLVHRLDRCQRRGRALRP